ncbi:MAG: hypothetical protein ACR2LR_17060, partial [Hassallia sp.]
KNIGEGWVDNRQLLPMLDGVDELESARQEFCVQTINQLLQSDCQAPSCASHSIHNSVNGNRARSHNKIETTQHL